MRLRKRMNKIMSSIGSAMPTSRSRSSISDTLRSSLSTPSTLAVQEAARNTLAGLGQKLSSSGRAIAAKAKAGIGKGESNDNDDYDGATQQVLRLVVGVGGRKNQKKGSRWQLLEEDEEDQDESEIEQNNDDERKEEMLLCSTNAADYSQISTIAGTSKAGNAAQWQQHSRLYCLPDAEPQAKSSAFAFVSVSGQSKLQSQDRINTLLNNTRENEDERESEESDDLNSSQPLHQIVLDGMSALLCNHERLDLLLELVNEQEQRAENEFAIKNTKNGSNFKEIIAKALRKKLRRVMLVGRLTTTVDNEENSIATKVSGSDSHRRFDVKQSKLIKSGDNVISISGTQPSGKRSMKKRMSLFRRKLKPSQTAAAAEQQPFPSSSSSSAITSNALVAISQTRARSKKKVIVKTLKSSGKQVGKALKTGFIAMGNSMIPQHYIFPSPLELTGSGRATSWQEETGYYSTAAGSSRTPYWREYEYEMYDQYEDDRRKYEHFYQQYAEARRRERHA